MKTLKSVLLVTLFFASKLTFAQNPENWTKEQLMEPAQLAQHIETGKHLPVLICVGPGASIPNSVDAGSVKEKENLDKLKTTLQGYKKNIPVVVYCGCCPFEHCPNVRPAVALLRELKFTNYKLLNLPHNLKTDWIDKGYPTAKL